MAAHEAPARAGSADSLQARVAQLELQVQLQTQTTLYLQQQLADVCQQLGIVALPPRLDALDQE